MAEHDDISIARELGAMNQSLSDMRGQLGELVAYQKAQNGRLGTVEKQVAILEDGRARQDREHAGLLDRFKELENRGRLWALGLGGPVLASLVLVLTGHA